MEAGVTDRLFSNYELVGIVDELEANQKDKRIVKPLSAAALALGAMLSSCSYVQRGPSPEDVRGSENEYEECLRTSDYPSECANEKQVRDFFTYHLAFHSEVLCHPGARTPAN
jgi:hypothetical protein